MSLFLAKTLEGFQNAAQSLRLYRRAEMIDNETGRTLTEQLYVDPLSQSQVINTLLRPNTTFLIGRKGTGKSTIFQKLQADLRKKVACTSAYLDIKTIFESSQISPSLLAKVQDSSGALPPDVVEKVLLYRQFVKSVIEEIKSELRKRVDGSIVEKLKESFTGGYAELFEGLDEILQNLSEETFVSILGVKIEEQVSKDGSLASEGGKITASGKLAKLPEFAASAEISSKNETSQNVEIKYSDILLRTINIKEILTQLKNVLRKLKIRHLYILVDDFSELPEEAMKVVVDVLLAPLNNWSDEFVKFKIASYPGRIYFGLIDKTKVDEVYLDLYKLYGATDVNKMEESAIEFTKRLVDGRLAHFCKRRFSDFVEGDVDEAWRNVFFATMANPRTLGYLLYYLHELYLINGKKIGVKAIQEASQRYYEEKIESYFAIGKFLHESFGERSSIFSLKELLEDIVKRAKELRYHDSEVIKKIKGRPPTSHFHVSAQYESLMSTLELNFFLTKYYEMSDRDGKKVTVFALNYGLCSKYSLTFGRPQGEREFRLYFVERFFDYTAIARSFMSNNQEISCNSCSQKFSYEQLDSLRLYKMRCPTCENGVVSVVNLSKKYEKALKAVDQELLLPSAELGILQTLHIEDDALRAGYIAAELDCSYQLVGRRGKNLADRGLVSREENEQGQRVFSITPLAEKSYFSPSDKDSLDVPVD